MTTERKLKLKLFIYKIINKYMGINEYTSIKNCDFLKIIKDKEHNMEFFFCNCMLGYSSQDFYKILV